MADSENSNASDKKVKTEQTASETIVGDASAEIKDSAESSVDVTETVDVPEEQAEAAKPQHVAKENRRGGKALREENEKLKERCKDAEAKYTRLLAECENIRQRNEKESGKLYDIGAKGVLEKLLPVVDNFERALAAIPEDEKGRPFESGVANTAEATLKCNIRYLSMGGPEQFGRQCYAAPLDIFHRSVMHILAEYPLALPDADICTSCYTADGYLIF